MWLTCKKLFDTQPIIAYIIDKTFWWNLALKRDTQIRSLIRLTLPPRHSYMIQIWKSWSKHSSKTRNTKTVTLRNISIIFIVVPIESKWINSETAGSVLAIHSTLQSRSSGISKENGAWAWVQVYIMLGLISVCGDMHAFLKINELKNIDYHNYI